MEFKGLKGQFIWWLAGGLVCLVIGFAILYISGVNSYICVAIAGLGGGFTFFYVYKLNNKYGQYGMMRKSAKKRMPAVLRSDSRKKLVRGKK